MRLFFLFATMVAMVGQLGAQNPLWLRYPSISPDGTTIAFNYKGDIYTVNSQGGQAQLLTTHPDHDFMANWSPDGKEIVFASNRYGNYDVFSMPSQGGMARRLTFNSANDLPSSVDRNGDVLFSSSRLDSYKNSQFPSWVLSELYAVNKDGKLDQVLTTPAEFAVWNKDGSKLLYQDKKGYENEWRKHHTSSVTRDIWIYTPSNGEHLQLTDFEGEDRNPVWSPDEQSVYYLSEQSGSFNVWKKELASGANTQITHLTDHPVRFLTVAGNGILSFSYDGELYTMQEGEELKKLDVAINVDANFNATQLIDVKSEVTEIVVSPNGKEMAFVARGEIFVSAMDYSDTKRITNTPEQERSISFSPDGKSILFAGERNGSWNLYQIKRVRDEENYFYSSTVLKEEEILVSDKETFQPRFSPDGKEVAYLEERVVLKVLNLKTKATRTILGKEFNYSYTDGDQSYAWSPDGKWFLVGYLPYNRWNQDVGLVSADGKKKINLTESGYDCHAPRWVMGGEAVIWSSGRNGMKSHGSWGTQEDVYIMFLTAESYDAFRLTESEVAELKESEKKEEKEEEKSKGEKGKEAVKSIQFDVEGAKARTRRLTIHSSQLSDAVLTIDGSKMYYLSGFEKGCDLWVQDFKKNETKLLAKLGGGNGKIELDKEEANIYVISKKGIKKVDAKAGKATDVAYSAKMEWNQQKEFEYIYDHAWRQTLKKFYVVDMHKVDWEFYKKEYAKFLPHITNGPDFAELLSELLGELNASHTGGRYRFSKKGGDKTASLGVFFNYKHQGPGVKVDEVMEKSPLKSKDSKATNGMVILAINGEKVNSLTHYHQLLNQQEGKKVLVNFQVGGKEYSQVVKPISQGALNAMTYERYVKNREAQVDQLSNGKVGYVHVKGMNDASFRAVYSAALGKHADKEALIVDTRFNGGGWLHDDLVTFLGGEMYATFKPRGQKIGHEPLSKWYKPSAVIIGEGNYSDAHGFPFAYRSLKLGKTIGMPVPGTMTAVWWEKQINPGVVFGIPQVGVEDMDGKLQENYQFEPDIKVKNDYKSVAEGKDKQLEAAVKELLKE